MAVLLFVGKKKSKDVDSERAAVPSCDKIHVQDMEPARWKNLSQQDVKSCSMLRDPTYGPAGRTECADWEYDTSRFHSTIASEWDLVCGSEYLVSTTQTLYFVGMITGVFVFGLLSDMYGRKTVLIPLLLVISVSGVVGAFVQTFELFIAAR